MLSRRSLLCAAFGLVTAPALAATWPERLVAAALAQVGKTTLYDPAYVKLAYPGGDVPIERGVCSDVVIRAYRDGLGVDLQKLVHEDMAAHFDAYPKLWGLAGTDRNIDHRRVPNLETFFTRKNAALPAATDAGQYKSGDLVTMRLPGNLPHIAIVTPHLSDDGARPTLVHNIGGGAQVEDVLFAFRLTGHYRFSGLNRA